MIYDVYKEVVRIQEKACVRLEDFVRMILNCWFKALSELLSKTKKFF
ncbi:hypothetical protein GXM_07287 [Nostoc sphaeroides CCNUC1]|uniref:Uncharacterized protein n=1 Tax=Nostoc sphaeroides CCNUC1 TaxID=2653204 RepID=A0A5P8WAH1_9NOSO|nr:hypothetical protein GXM_07287 [Nostoc sphaeroides CCNUC1]